MIGKELPVYRQKDRILEALKDNQVIVVESPTGSGKTTQLPIILYEAGYAEHGMIGVTQPRRIATLSVSDFIARELDCQVPGLVGYKMRFEDKTNEETRIKIVTDGMLLQEMKLDHELSKYSVIMIDEAHERSLNIDFLLGLLKRTLESRKTFRLIISSATINAEVFSEFYGECPVVRIDTQVFPVTVVYDPPAAATDGNTMMQGMEGAMLLKISDITSRILSEHREGDILIFLPGEKSIKDCIKLLSQSPWSNRLHLVPLYSRLGKEEQESVFEPARSGKTKMIVSTNIAETSITIDGITSVIDSGLAKLNFYNPKTYTSSLLQVPISKASCNQRKGRAGRTRPGTCYRLFTRDDFEARQLFTTEEIFRTDLTEVVLRMAELGLTEFENFDFITKPTKSGIAGAIDALILLEALNADRSLTSVGKTMCLFPLLPRHSRMIVEAILHFPDAIEEVIIAASFLSTSSPYILPVGQEIDARRAHHQFRDPRGDFLSYLKILRGFLSSPNKRKWCEEHFLDERTLLEILRIKEQLELIVSDMGVPIGSGGSVENYLTAVSKGLVQFVCVRTNPGMYRTLTAQKIQIHPSSVMYKETPRFIVAGEIVRTSRMYAMSVSSLDRKTLLRVAPRIVDFPDIFEEEASGKKQRPQVLVTVTATDKRKKPKLERKPAAADLLQHQIILGHQVFPIISVSKGKSLVHFEWSALAKALSSVEWPESDQFNKLRGFISVGKSRLMEGLKVNLILRIAKTIDIDADLKKKWPAGVNFHFEDDGQALLDALPHVMQITATQIPRKAKAKSPSNGIGFVALHCDENGRFWFTFCRGFHTALNESTASLEALADLLTEKDERSQVVNSLYRRLSEYF